MTKTLRSLRETDRYHRKIAQEVIEVLKQHNLTIHEAKTIIRLKRLGVRASFLTDYVKNEGLTPYCCVLPQTVPAFLYRLGQIARGFPA